jgi:hypothetical protein
MTYKLNRLSDKQFSHLQMMVHNAELEIDEDKSYVTFVKSEVEERRGPKLWVPP